MRAAIRIMARTIRTVLLLACLVLLLIMASVPALTVAQDDYARGITLTSSNPRANAVLATPPGTASLTFSTEVDAGRSSVELYTRDGDAMTGTEVSWPNPRTATITFNDDLPHGSYLVAWKVSAAGSNAAASGFYGFTVGTDQDVAPVTIPNTGFAGEGPPLWVSAAAYATLLVGMLILIAIWPVWVLLFHPQSVGSASPRSIPARLQQLAMAASIVMGFGVAGRIAIVAWLDGNGDWLNRLLTTIGDTRSGRLLLATFTVLSLHALILAIVPWTGTSGSRWGRLLPWLTTMLLSVPIVLLSHAADEPAGRIPAFTATWLLYVAVGLLVGGLIALLWTNRAKPTGPSGIFVAITIPVIVVTGAWLGWLYTGNRTALEDTTFGRTFLVTSATGILLAVAVVVTGVIIRRNGSARWLGVPVAMGIAFMIGIGSLGAMDTARESLARESSQRVVPFELGGTRAQLILAPGAAGVNHVRLEIDQASIPRRTTATLTMFLPSEPSLGSETVPLSRVSDSAFEYHGTELTIADTWNLDVTLTEPGKTATSSTFALDLDAGATTVDLPDTPWRFERFAGSAGMLMVTVGIGGVVIGVAAGRSPLRKESAGLGVTALIFAAILLGQGRLDPILAVGGDADGGAINPDDLAMITRGEEIYESHCLSCHGADLRGDGPASNGLQPPPADFAAPHTMVHDEATLVYWLRNGKQGTAMPGFSDTLSDQQIRDVLSYIERQQRQLAGDDGTPVPSPAP